MKHCMILFLLASALQVNAQSIPSSCNAPDSVLDRYRDDVTKLVARDWYDNGSDDTVNIIVSGGFADTVMGALVAVYNAASLPARDTVVNIFDIHAFWPFSHKIHMLVDTNAAWHSSWNGLNTLTGDPDMDALLTQYQLTITEYTVYSGLAYAEFSSPLSMNIRQLGNLFNGFNGISDAVDPSPFFLISTSAFTDIYYNATPGWQQLIYRYGWGDCPAGCMFNHFWKFKVYYDCSVEFVSSYGDPLNEGTIIIPPMSVGSATIEELAVYPNPFNDVIEIGTSQGSLTYTYKLMNGLGCTVASGELKGKKDIDTKAIPPGNYFLRLENKDGVSFLKLVKSGD